MFIRFFFFTPGDPAKIICGDTATEKELEDTREVMGLNKPFIVQLGNFLYDMFIKFDLGQSWVFKTNVSYELSQRLPYTVGICLYSILIGAIFGIPLGVAAAVRQNSWFDKLVLFMSSILHCVPSFCVALGLILLFSLHLRWLPAFGSDSLECFILPGLAIMIGSFARLARQMRSSMLEVLRSDFVVAARAQGFSRNKVYYGHALPNALIPIVTILGGQLAHGLGGTMIIETIFSIPGVGVYVREGITYRDRPVVMGCVVFLAVVFCLVMLGVDICYAILDPRIKAQYEEMGGGFLSRIFRKRRKVVVQK